MHLSMLIWIRGRPGKVDRFDKGSWPTMGVPGVGTFEFPPITNAL